MESQKFTFYSISIRLTPTYHYITCDCTQKSVFYYILNAIYLCYLKEIIAHLNYVTYFNKKSTGDYSLHSHMCNLVCRIFFLCNNNMKLYINIIYFICFYCIYRILLTKKKMQTITINVFYVFCTNEFEFFFALVDVFLVKTLIC